MANQTINNLTLDGSPLDSDELIVKKAADNRCKKTTRGTLRSGLTPTSRNVNTTAPLQGGGTLASDLTLTIVDASTSAKGAVQLATSGEVSSSKAVKADDSRLSNSRSPTAHKTSHQTGGSDELNVGGLDGVLNQPQRIRVYKNGVLSGTRSSINLIEGSNVTITTTDDGVGDEVEITIASSGGGGGSGNTFQTIACPSGTNPVADSTSDTLTLAATAPVTITGNSTTDTITIAVSDASTSAKGVVELATDGETAAGVAVQGNDSRLSNSRTPTAHASSHQDGGSDEISVTGLSGLLADAQKVEVSYLGTLQATRKRINLIPGANITIAVADDAPNNRVNIAIEAAGLADPFSYVDLAEDFLSGSTEVGEIGILNWTSSATTSTVVAAEEDHPGIYRIATNTTSGNIARLHLGGAATDGMFYAGDLDRLTAVIRPQNNTNMKIKFGLFQSTSDTGGGTDGIYFDFSTLVGPEWYCTTRASSTSTSQATLTAVSAATWYKLDIVRNGVNIDFYIDDALVATNTTNIPLGALNVGFQVECRDTGNAKSIDIDFFRLKSQALNR